MADDADKAAALAELALDLALHDHQQRLPVPPVASAVWCAECGDLIPHERRRAVKTEFCVFCQSLLERGAL